MIFQASHVSLGAVVNSRATSHDHGWGLEQGPDRSWFQACGLQVPRQAHSTVGVRE